MSFCTYCGFQIEDGDLFCAQCGQRFIGAEDEPVQAAPQVAPVPEPVQASAFTAPEAAPAQDQGWGAQPAAAAENAAARAGFEQPQMKASQAPAFSAFEQAMLDRIGLGETTVLKRPEATDENAFELRLKRVKTGEELVFKNVPVVSAGRNLDNEIWSGDSLISGKQARFEWCDGLWYLIDESRNGTSLNGNLLEKDYEYILNAGDEVDFSTAEQFIFLGTNKQEATAPEAAEPEAAEPEAAEPEAEGLGETGQLAEEEKTVTVQEEEAPAAEPYAYETPVPAPVAYEEEVQEEEPAEEVEIQAEEMPEEEPEAEPEEEAPAAAPVNDGFSDADAFEGLIAAYNRNQENEGLKSIINEYLHKCPLYVAIETSAGENGTVCAAPRVDQSDDARNRITMYTSEAQIRKACDCNVIRLQADEYTRLMTENGAVAVINPADSEHILYINGIN